MESDVLAQAERLRGRLQAAMICLSHSWGGLEQVAASDAVAVGATGHPMRVLCYQGSPIHENLAHKPEVQVIPIDFRPRNHFDFQLKAELDRLVAQGVNLFHCHQPSLLSSISPWFWRQPKIALLVSRHILSSHRKKDLYHRLIYSRVDQFIAMSRTLGENIRKTHALRFNQLRVINLGLDFQLFDPDRANPLAQRSRWGADEDMVVIGLVGRIDPAKGQATFIKAAAGLLKNLRAGERLKFVIVGEETLGNSAGFLAELKKMVAQFHLDEHVVFAGYQENIPEIMRALDIFVMPSRQEAFGLVAIEAMAMECPIIISQGGSSSEIVGEEEFGLTMKPEDPFDLQRQLRHLLDNPMMRVQMGQRAREHVMRHYDRRRRLAQTLQLYDEMLVRRGR